MDAFYTTILSIAAIILILVLTYIGILLYFAKSDEVYPPYQKPCPDYWEVTADGKCVFPVSGTVRNRGTLTVSNTNQMDATQSGPSVTPGVHQSTGANDPTTINFSDAGWKTVYGKKNDLCNKKYWADTFQIEWDGVTNTNQC